MPGEAPVSKTVVFVGRGLKPEWEERLIEDKRMTDRKSAVDEIIKRIKDLPEDFSGELTVTITRKDSAADNKDQSWNKTWGDGNGGFSKGFDQDGQ